jgi:hypothetical protein
MKYPFREDTFWVCESHRESRGKALMPAHAALPAHPGPYRREQRRDCAAVNEADRLADPRRSDDGTN